MKTIKGEFKRVERKTSKPQDPKTTDDIFVNITIGYKSKQCQRINKVIEYHQCVDLITANQIILKTLSNHYRSK